MKNTDFRRTVLAAAPTPHTTPKRPITAVLDDLGTNLAKIEKQADELGLESSERRAVRERAIGVAEIPAMRRRCRFRRGSAAPRVRGGPRGSYPRLCGFVHAMGSRPN